MHKQFRPGAKGALLDIYEETIALFKNTIDDIPIEIITNVIDTQTPDENCRSVQSILSHVVHAGFGYAVSIHNLKGNNIVRPEKTYHTRISEYRADLDKMFNYTLEVFNEIEDHELEQLDNAFKIKTGWGQWYHIEQIMEHAIVHVLRHQRQLQKLKLENKY